MGHHGSTDRSGLPVGLCLGVTVLTARVCAQLWWIRLACCQHGEYAQKRGIAVRCVASQR